MGITTEKKVVARCDVEDCKSVRYGTDVLPPVGFHTTVEKVTEDADGVVGHKVNVFACSLPHVKKAVDEALGLGNAEQILYSDAPEPVSA